jgi:hypothetical protein
MEKDRRGNDVKNRAKNRSDKGNAYDAKKAGAEQRVEEAAAEAKAAEKALKDTMEEARSEGYQRLEANCLSTEEEFQDATVALATIMLRDRWGEDVKMGARRRKSKRDQKKRVQKRLLQGHDEKLAAATEELEATKTMNRGRGAPVQGTTDVATLEEGVEIARENVAAMWTHERACVKYEQDQWKLEDDRQAAFDAEHEAARHTARVWAEPPLVEEGGASGIVGSNGGGDVGSGGGEAHGRMNMPPAATCPLCELPLTHRHELRCAGQGRYPITLSAACPLGLRIEQVKTFGRHVFFISGGKSSDGYINNVDAVEAVRQGVRVGDVILKVR